MASSSSSSSEERKAEAAAKQSTTYKTKVIQFLGRTTPIILQNDNGPCPLLAICNVLLLKNNLKLSPDVAEVSQEQLLSLIAERLIDSNSNVDNKDAGYVENQQQNISDAIDLLPRLTTGIDVNIKFNRIGDFEFTRECTIFDLLDIPLYHGWIVDPEDIDTVRAIGSKSYNTLMGDLVGLETQNAGTEFKKNPREDCVNFSATTAATLRVPSPSVSRGVSFDESIGSVPDELLRASKLQEGEIGAEIQKSSQQEPSISDDIDDVVSCSNDLITFEGIPGKKDVCLSSNIENEIPSDQSNCEESGQVSSGAQVLREAAVSDSCGSDLLSENGSNTPKSVGSEQVQEQSKLRPDIGNGSEPIYGGEEHILESGPTTYEDREPVYEGQVVPAEQVEKNSDVGRKNEMTPEQGELIKKFLKNCASQLTIYGLFCLQDGLKERELCVFFRNNHFNTMFKFDGELYILATDQGYINQPDLVWEKLNEVNGNTVFMTGSFKEFKIEENHANSSWDNIADYFGSSIDNPAEDHSSVDADRQIALALQNEENEAQQQQSNSQQPPVGGGSSRRLVTGPQVSKRSSGRKLPTPTKPEPKSSKDKMCVIM